MFLSKAARFGLYAVVTMASRPDQRISAGDVARTFDISENHVAKVLQQLARARIVQSVRGQGGGYRLARSPSDLTMLAIVECLEGPLPGACPQCSLRHPSTDPCPDHFATRAVLGVLDEVSQTAYFTLGSVTVATLVAARRSD